MSIANDDMLDMGLNWDSNSINKCQLSQSRSYRTFRAIGMITKTGHFDIPLLHTDPNSWSMTNGYDNGSATISPYINLRKLAKSSVRS